MATTSSCIHCGCNNSHVPTTNTVSKTFLKEPEDMLSSINAEISSIDDQIALLKTKRAALMWRANNIQSPVYSVPAEVLSYIFGMVAIDVSGIGWEKMRDGKMEWPSPHIPVILGSVSSYWRNVVHATPQIWTSMLVEQRNCSVAYRDKKIAFLRYYLERARNLPLSLGFKILDTSEENQMNMNAVFNIMSQENPARIKALHMTNLPIQSFALVISNGEANQAPTYTQLEVLSISNPLVNSNNFTLPPLPMLRRLKLTNTPTIQFITTTITCLHLVKMRYSDCMRLLLLCRDTIVEFESRQTHSCSFFEGRVRKRYILPRITIFRWENSTPYDDISPFILSHLDIPRMHTLHLVNYSPYQKIRRQPVDPTSSPLSVFALHLSWERVEDGYMGYEEKGIKRLLESLDATKLIIPQRGGEADHITYYLKPSSNKNNVKFLPSLKVLSIPRIDSASDPVINARILESIVQMLQERLGSIPSESLGGHHEPFILELPPQKDNSKIIWPKGCKKWIQSVVKAGLLQVKTCDYYLDMRKPTPFV